MRHFMAGFFLVFSFFKHAPGFCLRLQDVRPAGQSHSKLVLDLSIRRIAPWRRVQKTNVTTLVDVRGGVGVLQSLLTHHPVCDGQR